LRQRSSKENDAKSQTEFLEEAEVGLIEDVVEDVGPVVVGVRIEQRVSSHTVGEQEDDTEQSKVDEFYHLSTITSH